MSDELILGHQIIVQNRFDELYIQPSIKEALAEMGMVTMTPIQAQCIPHLLEGKDVLGAAKTGSGKTLAFLVPLVNKILKGDHDQQTGTKAIIISPTRELSKQIYDELVRVTAKTNITCGIVMGGENKNIEAKYLKEGITILVATPGRLLHHMGSTEFFLFHRLETLIIDEADKLMEQGFQEDMSAIVRKLPKKRQTVLFSATLQVNSAKVQIKKLKKSEGIRSDNKKMSNNDKVVKLAYLSLRDNYVSIDLSSVDLSGKEKKECVTNTQLDQSWVVTEPGDRFRSLYTFIKKMSKKKIMIFMASCDSVRFYYELLNLISVKSLCLHGKQKQSKRTRNLDLFRNSQCGLIICTDVACRGLDIPNVDWVVQYDPPSDPNDYIHRVGRTARAGASGKALLFLRPHEKGFLSEMSKRKVPMSEITFDSSKLVDIQTSFERIVESNKALCASGKKAFSSVVRSYQSNAMKCFDINKLDLQALARTFGLKEPPRVFITGVHTGTKRGNNEISDYDSSDNEYVVPSKTQKM